MVLKRTGSLAGAAGSVPGLYKEGLEGHSRIRILLVDDVPGMRLPLARFLRKEGYEVVEAGDGLEALNAFRAGGADLIISDLQMPNMDGAALLREARALDRSIPFIVVSAFAGEPEEAGLKEASALMGKPVDLLALEETVRSLLERPPMEETIIGGKRPGAGPKGDES